MIPLRAGKSKWRASLRKRPSAVLTPELMDLEEGEEEGVAGGHGVVGGPTEHYRMGHVLGKLQEMG
jgi:hypothetical protein